MSFRPHRRPGHPFKLPPRQAATPAKPAAPPRQCAKCHANLDAGATFCGACGAPVRVGVRPRRTMAEWRRNLQKGRNLRLIRSGANTLLLLALLNLAGWIFVYLHYRSQYELLLEIDTGAARKLLAADGGDLAAFDKAVWLAQHFGAICFLEYGLVGVIFLGLYGWARFSPLPATVAGLITYLTVLVGGLAITPAALLSPGGWVVRVAILGALGSAIQSATSERRIHEKEVARQKAEELARRRAALAQGEADPAGVAKENPG
ncbi:MAG: zinc ribbon domain-containing protein [Planctomycetota bacterium]